MAEQFEVIDTPCSSKMSTSEINELRSRGFADRGITRAIAEHFGVKCSMDDANNIVAHYYPYDVAGKTVYKQRIVADKEFFWIGGNGAGELFGKDKFQSGGKRLVIVEGEIDMLSVAQAMQDKYQTIYPVVGLPSATAAPKLLEHRDWLRSFEEVVLWFDPDPAGEKALEEARKIIGVDKVKLAKSPQGFKDPNEVLCRQGWKYVLTTIWDAQPWTPSGILQRDALWEALVSYNSLPSIPYPDCIGGLNPKLKGIRLGEITLFISGTGSGKSTLLREIMLHLLAFPTDPSRLLGGSPVLSPDDKIGVVSLEEAPAETVRKLSGMALCRNPANETIPVEELKPGFDAVFGTDRVVVLDHQGSIADGSIVEQLEYMALRGCKYLFIDHITILVSEGADGLTGNEAIDKVMNDLLRLVKRHNVWIGLVSHLRKAPTGKSTFEQGALPSLDDIKGCLAYDTPVMLSSGVTVSAQDVQVGDYLMGDRGDSRRVQRLCRGEQQMYRVTMKTTNDSFVCNEDHILTLSYNEEMIDIKLKDFLQKSEYFQSRCKQHYSEGYELPAQELLIPPYSLGAWLGDGSKSAFRIMDAIGLGVVERVANELGAILKAPADPSHEYYNFDTGVTGDMLGRLRALNIYDNKHIPAEYIFNTRKNRYELLAGLIDTDGTYSPKDNAYYFYQKDPILAEAVRDIARSLGLFSNIRKQKISGKYSSNGSEICVVTISGEIGAIPALKAAKLTNAERYTNALKRGITVEKLDVQPYYGFELDGNGRFLLGNHIITHNSGAIKQISFDVIGFARNMTAEDEIEKNTIEITVLKSRYTGLTGKAGKAYYNLKTSRLQNNADDASDSFEVIPDE
jgi:twinkle protein